MLTRIMLKKESQKLKKPLPLLSVQPEAERTLKVTEEARTTVVESQEEGDVRNLKNMRRSSESIVPWFLF